MGLTNILCDIVLLKCTPKYREEITEKKFEQIKFSVDEEFLAGVKNLLTKRSRSIDDGKVVPSVLMALLANANTTGNALSEKSYQPGNTPLLCAKNQNVAELPEEFV